MSQARHSCLRNTLDLTNIAAHCQRKAKAFDRSILSLLLLNSDLDMSWICNQCNYLLFSTESDRFSGKQIVLHGIFPWDPPK